MKKTILMILFVSIGCGTRKTKPETSVVLENKPAIPAEAAPQNEIPNSNGTTITLDEVVVSNVAKPGIKNSDSEITHGSLKSSEIRSVVQSETPKIRFCYEKELLQKNTKFEGLAKVTFTISEAGSVTNAFITTSLDENVDLCILGVIKGLHFPKPEGGTVTVSYPFNFIGTVEK